MPILTSFILAVGLAMDSFAVSLSVGATRTRPHWRPVARVAFHMGLFQGLLTLLGWFLGAQIAPLIEQFDHWVAMLLLSFIGIRMIQSGINPELEQHKSDPSRGTLMIALCIATSIDAFAVGLSLAMMKVEVLSPSLTIFLVTVLFSVVGLVSGGQIGLRFGKKMEVMGGFLLTVIGLRILLSHLLS